MHILPFYLPDILFSAQGSVKRIKIYTGPDGKKKGDALITYARPEAVPLACRQVSITIDRSIDHVCYSTLLGYKNIAGMLKT
jgi:hypothetical protein